MKYDIHNPTPAARVIYDGIPKNGKDGPQGEYYFPSESKRNGIELADHIAKELIERMRLTPHVVAPAPKSDDEIIPPKVAARK